MITRLSPKQIAQLLTESTRQLDESTLSALAAARQQAMQRYSACAPVFALTPASAHTSTQWTNRLIPHSIQQWITTGLLVIALIAGTGFWHHTQEQQISEIDVAILTDDVPIEALVD